MDNDQLPTCKCSRRPVLDSKLASHLSHRQMPLSVGWDLSFSGALAGKRIVVGADNIGESEWWCVFDSLLLDEESSSSSSTSSSSATDDDDIFVWQLSFSIGDNLDNGSWLFWERMVPIKLLQPFVKLLFSLTCALEERMQPLKSFVAGGLAVGLLDGGEHVFIGFGLASEISL